MLNHLFLFHPPRRIIRLIDPVVPESNEVKVEIIKGGGNARRY